MARTVEAAAAIAPPLHQDTEVAIHLLTITIHMTTTRPQAALPAIVQHRPPHEPTATLPLHRLVTPIKTGFDGYRHSDNSTAFSTRLFYNGLLPSQSSITNIQGHAIRFANEDECNDMNVSFGSSPYRKAYYATYIYETRMHTFVSIFSITQGLSQSEQEVGRYDAASNYTYDTQDGHHCLGAYLFFWVGIHCNAFYHWLLLDFATARYWPGLRAG